MAGGFQTFGKICFGYILGITSTCLVWYYIPTPPSLTLQQNLNLSTPALPGQTAPPGPNDPPGLQALPPSSAAVSATTTTTETGSSGPPSLQVLLPANLTLAHSLKDWLMKHHGHKGGKKGQQVAQVPYLAMVSAALAAAEVPDKFPDLREVWELISNSKLLTWSALGQRLHLITGIKDTYTEMLVFPETRKDGYNIVGFKHAEKNLTMLDIGGHIGTVAILFKKMYPTARVISFEPSPVNRLYFSINMALNGIPQGPEGIELHARALSNADGQKLDIKYSFVDTTDTGAFYPNANADKTHRVPTITLDTTFKEFGIDTVDFMKLDCEGCEYLVLPSCTAATLNQIKYVAGEIHPWVGAGEKAKHEARQIMCARKWNIGNIQC